MNPTEKKLDNQESRPAGLGQLTLVEHCLCPLDARSSLRQNLVHECEYVFHTPDNGRQTGRVRVHCPAGLSPTDEFFLWGMLGVTLAQEQPSFDVHATPHYWLRQLGCISEASKGGKSYERFREAIRRLSCVHYENDSFYDPIQGEHRAVSFGLLSYSLPMNPDSSRAWRIVWDPLFFDFLKATGSHLAFDLQTYRDLDLASRRLFLLLKKIFWRRHNSPWFDVRHLAVNVIGFSPDLETRTLKAKLKRCAESLIERKIIRLPDGTSEAGELFQKQTKGEYGVRFWRGSYFNSEQDAKAKGWRVDSPLAEPLERIGFDAANIQRILGRYRHADVQLWADITLAAIEHKGNAFFRRNPEAYFLDNIKHAAKGQRTPPDWFHELRKAEEARNARAIRRNRRSRNGGRAGEAGNGHKSGLERVAFENLLDEVFASFRAAGQSAEAAQRNAERMLQEHARRQQQSR